jgi:hypothetical protein
VDWILDLLTAFTHHSELQVIIVPPLISTLHKSLHAKSPPAYSVNSRFLATDVNSGGSSVSRSRVLPSRFQYTACQLSTELAKFCLGSSLYSLCANPTEKTASNSFFYYRRLHSDSWDIIDFHRVCLYQFVSVTRRLGEIGGTDGQTNWLL